VLFLFLFFALYFFCVCCVNFAIVFLYFCLVLWCYLDSCLPDLLLGFNLGTFVLKFTGALLSTAPDENVVPLQAGQILGQLLQTPFVVHFLGFFNQDLKDRANFWPITYYLLVFATMYFYFGTVVRELTLVLILEASNFSSF
jgi:hypothetical protein